MMTATNPQESLRRAGAVAKSQARASRSQTPPQTTMKSTSITRNQRTSHLLALSVCLVLSAAAIASSTPKEATTDTSVTTAATNPLPASHPLATTEAPGRPSSGTELPVSSSASRDDSRSSEALEHPAVGAQKSADPLAAATTTSAPTTQTTNGAQAAVAQASQPATAATKNAPVLRPSLEAVAGELSRKHLNLEHENWRLKQSPGLSSADKGRPEELVVGQQSADNQTDPPKISPSSSGSGSGAGGGDEEQEIILQAKQTAPTSSSVSAGELRSQVGESFLSKLNERHRDQYLHLDPSATSAMSAGRTRGKQQPGSGRRAKKGNFFGQHSANLQLEDNELYQCHLYLQQHSSSSSQVSVGQLSSSGGGQQLPPPASNRYLPRLTSGQQLPCSCDFRKHFAEDDLAGLSSGESVWLSCDSVQLIGSHLFLPYQVDMASNGSSVRGEHDDANAYEYQNSFLTRFSQRDAGLQILYSQKFHYLQLFHLNSIDLSNNRIRNIKMDAFHGLEMKLEHLNLANNLLGDFRAAFDAAPSSNPRRVANNYAKLVFSSDELNRLKKLRWLSLQNNQIGQLDANIFVKMPATGAGAQATAASQSQRSNPDANSAGEPASELVHLDLSDNILGSVPSDSIRLLSKLQSLKLNRNRISQLDQSSKFPRSLKHLDLSENSIKLIRQCDLIDLPHLLELDLSHNQLSHLDKTAFVSSTSGPLSSASGLIAHPDGSQLSSSSLEGLSSSVGSDGTSRLLFDKDESASSEAHQIREIVGADSGDANSESGKDKMSARTRRRRRFVEPSGALETDESSPAMAIGESDIETDSRADDLEAEESILTAFRRQMRSRQELSEEPAIQQPMDQFNSTRKLNLSYNFFESIPGDSLLKFSNLEQLDISYNRIRKVDANYLCSIYNLVENLRHLDLSGNLLTLSSANTNTTQPSPSLSPSSAPATPAATASSTPDGAGNVRQLNRLFGCLQKLEKLSLSANRLAAQTASNLAPAVMYSLDESDDGQQLASGDNNLKEATLSSSPAGRSAGRQDTDRLTIKFGEGFASKHMNTLDLSDNQLLLMPIIEQIVHQPTIVFSNDNSTNPLGTTNQQQLNQWMSSHVHLEVLRLSYNYLERLEEHEFEHLFNLRELYLDFNKLSALPVRLMRRFTSLDRLSLNGNRIGQLDPLNELLERSAKTLRVLNLANNRLMEWPQLNKRLIAETLASNYNREFIKQQQPAGVLPSADGPPVAGEDSSRQTLVFALEELNLEGNLLTSANVSSLFDQLIHMRHLRVLNLAHNLLGKVRSEWFKYANVNLRQLSFTGNRINSIDLGSFAWNQLNELTRLNLDYNILKELKRKTFDSLPKIRELNLGHNLIHTINSETFHQVNSLQILRLNNNKLTSWKCEYFSNLCNSISGNINADLSTLLNTNLYPFAVGEEQPTGSAWASSAIPPSVSSLVELDLSHNSLSQLRANSISVHTKLARLNLEHNKLSFIPHDLFRATTSGSSQLNGRQVQLVSSLKYLNLAHNRIQTIDNINFRPLRNLLALDLSNNELQTLGVDVVLMDPKSNHHDTNHRQVIVANNLTQLVMEDDDAVLGRPTNSSGPSARAQLSQSPAATWPALSKLRHLNLSNNQLTLVNQSLLSELSPFALLNLNLSNNYLDSESLPYGFYAKIAGSHRVAQAAGVSGAEESAGKQESKYDLVFTLKLESLDLSHNRLAEFPANLLDNHYTSLESCNLAYNRIQNLQANANLLLQVKSLNLEFNPLSRESNELVLFEQRSARYLNLAATRLYAIQMVSQAPDRPTRGSSSDSGYLAGQLRHRLANQTSQLDLIRSISRPIDAPYLRHLNLSSNQLVWLAANVFDRMLALQTLDLSNNQLTRLHLLNNQLSHVASSLTYLNMASNLFTNIDSTDFSQLAKIEHLDLSNLLSLQKMNCQFLAKLSTLKTLRMVNYPQMRQTLANLYAQLDDSASSISDRMRRRIRTELLMSTVGQHCFQEPTSALAVLHPDATQDRSQGQQEAPVGWANLHELELELLYNFGQQTGSSGQLGGFRLNSELLQMLGPKLARLTLVGLNLTSLADDSLLGITSDELRLRISYTSMSQLPLRPIMVSVTKRTKLDLDFRNNLIQTVDMRGLQLLDELQLNNQVLQRSDHSSLKLSSNPIRCDCHTRPLWLWLNQRWASADSSSPAIGANSNGAGGASDEQAPEAMVAAASADYWLKLNSISQTSDLKCYYPVKLRGRLTQHVNYNDLLCKGSSAPTRDASGRHSRKRNETRPASDVHFLASGSIADQPGDLDELDDDEYLESDLRSPESLAQVRLTKFNKYPVQLPANLSAYFQLSLGASKDEQEGELEPAGRSVKRERNSPDAPAGPAQPLWTSSSAADDSHTSGAFAAHPHLPASGNYSKHRPNTHQKHSHFSTLSAFNQLSRGLHGGRPGAGGSASVGAHRHSLLTDSDVLILTVIAVAMAVMSFVIITVCLFKYKLDQSDKEHIMGAQGSFAASPFVLGGKHVRLAATKSDHSSGSASSSSAKVSPSSSKRTHTSGKLSASKSGSLGSPATKSASSGASSSATAGKASKQQRLKASKNSTSSHQHHQLNSSPKVSARLAPNQVVVPVVHNPLLAARNPRGFLMRSPTIRRVHGLASNASDWFKYTLRAYPNSSARRRHLHPLAAPPTASANPQLASQLPASHLAPSSQFRADPKRSPGAPASGCPTHAFRCLRKLRTQAGAATLASPADEQCLYCAKLLSAVQQTQVQYLAGGGPEDAEASELGNAPDAKAAEQYYLPPRLIRALARQLDEEEQHQQPQQQQPQHVEVDSDWRREASKQAEHRAATGRDGQLRPSMRTFGMGSRTAGSEAGATHAQTATPAALVESQIPTIDVDGKFTYQTESQLDSPTGSRPASLAQAQAHADEHQRHYDAYTHTPSTQVGAGDDIFILVPETPAETPEPRRAPAERADRFEVMRMRERLAAQMASPPMQDECSRTSSPVTYGFMRSTPSVATSRSSATLTQSQYVVNASEAASEASRVQSFSVQQINHLMGGRSERFESSVHNNNNNNTEYQVGAKYRQTGDRQGVAQARESPANDDKIIISRL